MSDEARVSTTKSPDEREKDKDSKGQAKRKHGDPKGSTSSLLQELEEAFPNRYSDTDQAYVKLKNRPKSQPPIYQW